MKRTLSVTSGKGGVGKTLTAINFAVAARRCGHRVLILDGDMGMANVDVVLGLQPRYNIRDVLDGHVQLNDIVIYGPLGIGIIPSGSGISRLSQLSHIQKQQIFEQITKLDHQYDLLIIDTGAGIADTVMTLNRLADTIVVVTTPEPHAMTDAYALIKVLAEEHGIKKCSLMVNQCRSRDEGLKIGERIAEVAMRFLNVQVRFLGHVPVDQEVSKAVMRRQAASEQSSLTLAGQSWNQIAHRLLNEAEERIKPGVSASFWSNLLTSEPALRSTYETRL